MDAETHAWNLTVEKYGRLIYVKANEPRHRVMRVRSREACWPNVAIIRTGVAT